MAFKSFRPEQDKVGTFSTFSDTWLIESKPNVLTEIWVNVCTIIDNCMVVPKGKLKSACRILLPINPMPRSCPFSLPVTFLHTANLQTVLIALSPSLSPIVSLSLSKSPSKSYRGNSQQKINICLVNSLTTIKDTVGLVIKALMETIYAAEEAVCTKSIWIDNNLIYLIFFKTGQLRRFLKNGFTAPAPPYTVPVSTVNEESLWKPFLSAEVGEEGSLKTSTGLHIDFTLKSGCW